MENQFSALTLQGVDMEYSSALLSSHTGQLKDIDSITPMQTARHSVWRAPTPTLYM